MYSLDNFFSTITLYQLPLFIKLTNLTDLTTGEPARCSLGVPEKRTPILEARLKKILDFGVTTIARDTLANFKLVGIRTAYTVTRYFGHS